MAADADIHPWTGLPALLERLDECLAVAADNAVVRYGIGLGADPYRGLYVGDEQVQRLLQTRLDVAGFGRGQVTWPRLAYARAASRPTAAPLPALLSPRTSRTSTGVYECPGCGQRLAAERRCPDCQLFARRIGDGGSCTGCGEVLTVTELLGLE